MLRRYKLTFIYICIYKLFIKNYLESGHWHGKCSGLFYTFISQLFYNCFTSCSKSQEGTIFGSLPWEPHGHKIQKRSEEPLASTFPFVELLQKCPYQLTAPGASAPDPGGQTWTVPPDRMATVGPEHSLNGVSKKSHWNVVCWAFFLIVGMKVMETKLLISGSWNWKFHWKMCSSPMHVDLHEYKEREDGRLFFLPWLRKIIPYPKKSKRKNWS